MKPSETVLLVEYIQAMCPQQAIGEFTADAWHDLLGDLSLADCRAAVVMVAKRQPFVAPSEIRAAVREIHAERLGRNPVPPPPAELLDDPKAYAEHLARETKRITSGDPALRAIEGGAQ